MRIRKYAVPACLAAVMLVMSGCGGGQKNTATESKRSSAEHDLQEGGVSVTLQIKDRDPQQSAIEDTLMKLEKKMELLTNDYRVYQSGDDEIKIEAPGIASVDEVLDAIRTRSLYFIPETDRGGSRNYSLNGATGEYKLEYELSEPVSEELIENGKVLFDGSHIRSAEAAMRKSEQDSPGQWEVDISFDDEGTKLFADATARAYANGESIGIYYDGAFISVPNVLAPITDGNCVINGMIGQKEAEELAAFLRIGAMPLTLETIEAKVIGK